jgi:hypothetical protein
MPESHDNLSKTSVMRGDVKNGHLQPKYSTTSSVYAEHSLSNPNNDQVLYW